MNRAELQQLVDLRLEDAIVRLEAGRWGAAFYLLGYCVGCAIKVCIAEQFREHEVPEKKLVNAFYTHRVDDLLTTSRLRAAVDARCETDQEFEKSWTTVRYWSEEARYHVGLTEATAKEMFSAVTDSANGVLPWLKMRW